MKTALLLTLAAVFAAITSYHLGKHEARQEAAVEAAKQTAIAIEERAKTDEKIGSLAAAALCLELGGLPNECAKLRRLETDNSQTDNSSLPRRK